MKYLFAIILILGGIAVARPLDAARFDWTLGEPKIADDNVNTTYYCWSLGQPTICYQFQEAPTAEPKKSTPPAILWFE